MNIKTTLLVLLAIIQSALLSGQLTYENEEYGFSMQSPPGWIVSGEQEIVKNLDRIEMSTAERLKILKDRNGSILLSQFQKYEQNQHNGLIPTIQINVRENPAPYFSRFNRMIVQSADGFKRRFKDFKFEEGPDTILISGIKSVYFVASYTMETKKGKKMYVRSSTYAIPKGPYFFQVNFTDGRKKEDCSAIFEELVNSIVIKD